MLKLVQVVFRHGDRSPLLNPFLNTKLSDVTDKYWNSEILDNNTIQKMSDYFPVIGPQISVHKPPYGCLTKRGSEQLKNLGLALQEQYISSGFLQSPLLPHQIIASSTAHVRTQQSAQFFLSGFLEINQYKSHESWMPNIETTSQEGSFILPENKEIYSYANERLKEKDWMDLCNKYENVRSDILHHLPGLKEHPTWNYIFDYYYTSNAHNLKIPVEVVEYMSMSWIKCLYTNPRILKYSTDELLKIMYAFMNACKEKKSDTKMIIYSGHDTTIFPLLMCFSPYLKDYWPPYASCIQIELYENDNNKYYVKILYQGQVLSISDKFTDNMIPLNYFPSLGVVDGNDQTPIF